MRRLLSESERLREVCFLDLFVRVTGAGLAVNVSYYEWGVTCRKRSGTMGRRQ